MAFILLNNSKRRHNHDLHQRWSKGWGITRRIKLDPMVIFTGSSQRVFSNVMKIMRMFFFGAIEADPWRDAGSRVCLLKVSQSSIGLPRYTQVYLKVSQSSIGLHKRGMALLLTRFPANEELSGNRGRKIGWNWNVSLKYKQTLVKQQKVWF